MNIVDLFKSFGKLFKKAIGIAHQLGLDDALIRLTKSYIERVESNMISNEVKRETVVSWLVADGHKESVARLALEIAFQIYKAEK